MTVGTQHQDTRDAQLKSLYEMRAEVSRMRRNSTAMDTAAVAERILGNIDTIVGHILNNHARGWDGPNIFEKGPRDLTRAELVMGWVCAEAIKGTGLAAGTQLSSWVSLDKLEEVRDVLEGMWSGEWDTLEGQGRRLQEYLAEYGIKATASP